METTYRKKRPFEKFKKFMSDNNVKQKELAQQLGRSQSFVNNALNRRGAEFSIIDFRNIGRIFKINIHEYF